MNGSENEAENKKYLTNYDINKPRSKHGQKYTKYVSQYNMY